MQLSNSSLYKKASPLDRALKADSIWERVLTQQSLVKLSSGRFVHRIIKFRGLCLSF